MVLLGQAVEVVASGVVRLGPLRVSGYGLCAAVGLVAALGLSLRTARRVGLEPVEIWDAGLFGLGAAFVISRALLVVRDPHAFRMYPMLVMALPSFTYLGMALTAVAVLVYVRVRRLRLLAVMDAWAPCGAVLGAALCLGHLVEGTDAGMPWGFGGRLLPVQVVGAVVALGLALLLLRELKRHALGFVGGLGLVVGGLAAFVMDMVTQPVQSGEGWLESGQWIAIGVMIVGVVVLQAAKERV